MRFMLPSLLFLCLLSNSGHAQRTLYTASITKVLVPSIDHNGTGLLISKQDAKGYVVTAAHVVSHPEDEKEALDKAIPIQLQIRSQYDDGAFGETLTATATLELFNAKLDLALLSFDWSNLGNTAVEPKEVLAGFDDVVACQVKEMTTLKGYAGGTRKEWSEVELMLQGTKYYDSDLAFRIEAEGVERGYSGSPVFNTQGEWMGLMLSINGSRTATKVLKLKAILAELKAFGHTPSLVKLSKFCGVWRISSYTSGNSVHYFTPDVDTNLTIHTDGSISGVTTGSLCTNRNQINFSGIPDNALRLEVRSGAYGLPTEVLSSKTTYDYDLNVYSIYSENRSLILDNGVYKVQLDLIGFLDK